MVGTRSVVTFPRWWNPKPTHWHGYGNHMHLKKANCGKAAQLASGVTMWDNPTQRFELYETKHFTQHWCVLPQQWTGLCRFRCNWTCTCLSTKANIHWEHSDLIHTAVLQQPKVQFRCKLRYDDQFNWFYNRMQIAFTGLTSSRGWKRFVTQTHRRTLLYYFTSNWTRFKPNWTLC